MKSTLPIAALLSLLMGNVAAAAPILIIDSNGNLTGARDVAVGAALYDVDFRDGFCGSLFRDCDYSVVDTGLPDFAFTTQDGATLAAQALLDQVFLDSALGNFDTEVFKTRGCQNGGRCQALVPWFFDPRTNFYDSSTGAVGAINTSDPDPSDLEDQVYKYSVVLSMYDTGNGTGADGFGFTDLFWAQFRLAGTDPTTGTDPQNGTDPSAVVPEPTSVVLLITGLAATAARLGRRRDPKPR